MAFDANDTRSAQELSQYLSTNFVDVARANPNRLESESDLYNILIYNYPTTIPDDLDEDYNMFTELYLFDKPTI